MPRRMLNSTKLGNNFIKKINKKREFGTDIGYINRYLLGGYQRHHIIPSEVVSEYQKQNNLVGIDLSYFDESWNCLMLPSENDGIIHRGSHPIYSRFVYDTLIKIQEYENIEFIEASEILAEMIVILYDIAVVDYRKKKLQKTLDEFTDEYLAAIDTLYND